MSFDSERLLVNEDGSARDRIIGFETEYALSVRPIDAHKTGFLTLREIAVRMGFRDSKYSVKPNVFGVDGDREYIDVGDHPEISTAEELSFERAAFRVARGHVKVAQRYANTVERLSGFYGYPVADEVTVVANTCDPNTNLSWGSHQNYLTRRALEFRDFIPAFTAHNSARIVWSGVGRVMHVRDTAGGFKYTLSEKAPHIHEEVGSDTVNMRSLVNTRDEPEADAQVWRRIHDVSGETAMNPYVNAMRMASASIILRACELGVRFDDIVPVNPVMAMKEISFDPSLRRTIELENGERVTGLDLEEKIAIRSIVNAFAAGYITAQELTWGIRWVDLLDDLREDPLQCADRVDWVLKQQLIGRGLEQPRKDKETDFTVAWAKAIDYHKVLPEGAGMRMLRKGKFKLSPTKEMLDEGLPLPPTRAKLRGRAFEVLRKARRDFTIDWQHIKLNDAWHRTIILKDPYAQSDDRLARLLATVNRDSSPDEDI